jgi:hypothetical protein
MPTGAATSPGQLFQLIRSGAVHTRGELRALTGMARSTVTHRVDAPLTAGYLVEDGASCEPGRGRPSARLCVNDRQRPILVADLGATHGRLAVCTPAGDVPPSG